jgi:hypothetical protein
MFLNIKTRATIALGLLPLLALIGNTRGTIGAAVLTTSGTVTGHYAKNATRVSEYLGIRYAQAANGTLRFQPPVAYISSDHYAASSYVST